MSEHLHHERLKRAASLGLGAVAGMQAAHGPAKLVGRVPGIGPVLKMAVLAVGALKGAASAGGGSSNS